MNRVRNRIAGAIIAAGAISGFILKFVNPVSIVHLWVAPVLCGFLLLLSFVILFLCGIVTALRSKPFGSRIRSAGLIWCACALSLFLSQAISNSSYYWEYYSVRAYVAKAVPVLNAIKAKTGSYPAKLPTAELGEPPSVLKYFGEKDYYSFQYWETGGWGDTYIFLGSDGAWHEYG